MQSCLSAADIPDTYSLPLPLSHQTQHMSFLYHYEKIYITDSKTNRGLFFSELPECAISVCKMTFVFLQGCSWQSHRRCKFALIAFVNGKLLDLKWVTFALLDSCQICFLIKIKLGPLVS